MLDPQHLPLVRLIVLCVVGPPVALFAVALAYAAVVNYHAGRRSPR